MSQLKTLKLRGVLTAIDEIMTTAILDRLLHYAHIFTLTGESYRLLNKREVETV